MIRAREGAAPDTARSQQVLFFCSSRPKKRDTEHRPSCARSIVVVVGDLLQISKQQINIVERPKKKLFLQPTTRVTGRRIVSETDCVADRYLRRRGDTQHATRKALTHLRPGVLLFRCNCDAGEGNYYNRHRTASTIDKLTKNYARPIREKTKTIKTDKNRLKIKKRKKQ